MGRRVGVAAAPAIGVLLGSLSLGAAPAAADSCPNAQFRTGYAAALPDCRAYEQVTPVNKDSQPPYLVETRLSGDVAAVDGDGMAWTSEDAIPGSQSGGISYLSTRGADGWNTVNQIPPQSSEGGVECLWTVGVAAYSSDLASHVLADGGGQDVNGSTPNCGHDDPELVPGEPQGTQNLFLEDASGDYQLLSPNPISGPASDAGICGSTPDLRHVLVGTVSRLTPDTPAPPAPQGWLYDWSGGTLHLVNVLPNGTPDSVLPRLACGVENLQQDDGLAGGTLSDLAHAISTDGSRIFLWMNDTGNLYVRINPDMPPSTLQGVPCLTQRANACTVQVDASQGPGPGGGGFFQWASADGSQVFFDDDATAGLTSDTVPGSGTNLYRFDTTTGQLTDLTPVASAQVGAGDSSEGVLGASDDGSYVYFVAAGDLAPGATAGEPNLYAWHEGTTTFIATLDSGDTSDWAPYTSGQLTSRVSPNGRYLVFDSNESLTAAPANGFTQVYLYDASSGQLRCASCNPTGEPATGPAAVQGHWEDFEFVNLTHDGPTPGDSGGDTLPRNLAVAPDGSARVFFESTQALLPAASNSEQNVYEYANGQLSLISSGTSGSNDVFLDASANGNDVFFASGQQLAPTDDDGAPDIYDARVDGGFPIAAPTPECDGDGCKPLPASAPPPVAAASVTFVGPGDETSGETTARVRVLHRTVKGTVFILTVRAPAPGRLRITGAGVSSVTKTIDRPGAYKVSVALTGRSRRSLKRKHRMRVSLHVSYAPADGLGSSVTVSFTVKR